MRERGFGIAVPEVLRSDLVARGYLDPDMPAQVCRAREWRVADGSRTGKPAWLQPMPAALCNWGVLWRNLRSRIDDGDYRTGVRVTGIEPGDDGVWVRTDAGREQFDLVVGADGYRSEVRSYVAPGVRSDYAGYALWRGNFPEERLPDALRAEIPEMEHTPPWIGFDGGNGGGYFIPDINTAGRRLNWAVYGMLPEGIAFDDPVSVPPGAVGAALADRLAELVALMPPVWADIIGLSSRAELTVQPVYEAAAPSFVRGRILLIGDAAAVVRPHTAAGATKALNDALALERAATGNDTPEAALAEYDAARSGVGAGLMGFGRRMGVATVERTPPWTRMSAADFEAWFTAIVQGTPNPYDR